MGFIICRYFTEEIQDKFGLRNIILFLEKSRKGPDILNSLGTLITICDATDDKVGIMMTVA